MGGADAGEIGLGDVDHLVNAAARGVSLQIPKAIGGAGVEADAAVDAAGKVFIRGVLAWDRGGGSHLCSVRAMRNGSTTREGWRGDVWLSFVLGRTWVYPPCFTKSEKVASFVWVAKGSF